MTKTNLTIAAIDEAQRQLDKAENHTPRLYSANRNTIFAALQLARRVLKAQAAGGKTVKRGVTDEMLAVGAIARDQGNVKDIWQAMHQAAPDLLGGDDGQ